MRRVAGGRTAPSVDADSWRRYEARNRQREESATAAPGEAETRSGTHRMSDGTRQRQERTPASHAFRECAMLAALRPRSPCSACAASSGRASALAALAPLAPCTKYRHDGRTARALAHTREREASAHQSEQADELAQRPLLVSARRRRWVFEAVLRVRMPRRAVAAARALGSRLSSPSAALPRSPLTPLSLPLPPSAPRPLSPPRRVQHQRHWPDGADCARVDRLSVASPPRFARSLSCVVVPDERQSGRAGGVAI